VATAANKDVCMLVGYGSLFCYHILKSVLK